jgi:hypothetical protein
MKLTTMTQVTVDGVMQGNGGASDEDRRNGYCSRARSFAGGGCLWTDERRRRVSAFRGRDILSV